MEGKDYIEVQNIHKAMLRVTLSRAHAHSLSLFLPLTQIVLFKNKERCTIAEAPRSLAALHVAP
jgi:hypothetical protein